VYLTGGLAVALGDRPLDERELPGRQGRLALAYLVLERARPVSRDELADAIWADGLPPAWDPALSALVSMLRRRLATLGLPPRATIESAGTYQLRLPDGAWVDVEAAPQSLDEAEGALRGDAGRCRRARERGCRLFTVRPGFFRMSRPSPATRPR
jgi:DNA-binding SARP family transcriptional activator